MKIKKCNENLEQLKRSNKTNIFMYSKTKRY